MKLSSFAVPILSASTALALSKSLRPYRRTLVQDVCGSLNADLTLNDVMDSNGEPTVAGHIAVCLCVSDVAEFVQSNVVAQKAVNLVGDQAQVEELISNMVTGLPTASHCSYPDHASAVCTDSNPCDFECTDGYLAFPPENPTSCQCPDQLMECNGKCGHFKTCPSQAPASRRNNEPKCADGLTMCGCGTSTGQPWKCVDVTTDPMNCGGCVNPSPFGNAPVNGVNCTAIEGVNRDTVTCGNNHCIVKDCAEGFSVSPASDTCIPNQTVDGSNQSSGAVVPGSSSSTGSNGSPKTPRDAAFMHIPGIPIVPLRPIPRDVTGGIQQGVDLVAQPVLDATERLTASGSASPAGVVGGVVQNAEVVSPVADATEYITGGFKVTRNVGPSYGVGVAPVDVAKSHTPGAMGPLAGIHRNRA
jgi:hypothetical protein